MHKNERSRLHLALFILICICFMVYVIADTKKDHEDDKYPRVIATVTTVEQTTPSVSEVSSTEAADPSVTSPTYSNDQSTGMAALYEDALAIDIESLPTDTYAITLNDGIPYFTDSDLTISSYEYYSPLDDLGRCGYAMACLSTDLQPAPGEERESISSVHPSGWHSYEAEDVDGDWLYNRSHLIGWQLAGENANERNLITGTRQFNVDGMLPQEMAVDDVLYAYPEIHIMYRVTPIYEDDNLVANGVVMEAFSVEDNGSAITYCFFIPNIQDGWIIDYATGEANHI